MNHAAKDAAKASAQKSQKLLREARTLVKAIDDYVDTPINCEDDRAYADHYLMEAVKEFYVKSTGKNPWKIERIQIV